MLERIGTEKPLVAIQCLVYNHEKYLRDCLDGFVMQKTNFKFVAVVHDDVSIDNSASIIREYEQKYPDIIKPIYETENQFSKGENILNNIMVSVCYKTGAEYIAFCEGDDYWTDPYKLQKQVDFLESHPDVGLCYTDYNICDENGRIVKRSCFLNRFNVHPKSFEEHLLNAGYIAPMTWVYRSSALQFISNSNIVTDGTFAYALEFFKNSKVEYIADSTAVYRSHVGSASNPGTEIGYMKQYKGVFETQLYYAKKYKVSDSLLDNIKSKAYISLLPSAVRVSDTNFISEAELFFNDKNINFEALLLQIKRFISLQEENAHLIRDYTVVSNSKAYKIGRFLLKPIKLIFK